MRAALSHEFKAIIPTYDEKPRTKWILENSVQNTVVVSRLFFTQEVRRAGWIGGRAGQRVGHRLGWGCLCEGTSGSSQGRGFQPECLLNSPPASHPPILPLLPPPQVNEAFESLEDGNEDALKEVLERQKAQLRCNRDGEGECRGGGMCG